MNYEVIFTDTAKQDLKDIAFYIARESKDKEIAKNFLIELRNKTKQLAIFPNAGTFPKDRILKSFGYRYIVYKEYLLFYCVDENAKKVFVMSIFNEKKDYMRVIKG